MTKNTVSRVEFKNTSKRERERVAAISEDEWYAARPRLVRGKDPTPEERYGTLRTSRNVVPQTLAMALGAEVDPMEIAKEGYRKIARGEVEDPLLSRGAARAIGVALAGYQGLEAVAGATGIGNSHTISPPKSPRGGNLGPRGAAAGYVAEKSGRSVEDVLKQNEVRRTERQFDAIYPEGRAEMEARAEALAAMEAEDRMFDDLHAMEANAIAADTADAISRHRIRGSLDSAEVDIEKALDAVRGDAPIDRKNSLVAVRIGDYKGSGHPSFMILPADDAKSTADYIQKWARFGVAAGGGDVTFVPLSSIDPAVDPRNTLFSGDAYTKSLPSLFDELYGKGSFNQMADEMRHSAEHHRKTDGSPLTKHDVELQVQRRASDMVTSVLQASDPQTYNPNIPGLRQFDGINEATRKFIYDKFRRDNTFAEAKPRRVLSGNETFTIEGDSSDYDPESGGFTRHMYSGDSPDRTKLLEEAIIRYRQDAKGGNTRTDADGGDVGSEAAVSETPISEAPQNPGGPRIVINPQVFNDKRDALCVAFNEALRLVMEANGFEPVSEPTEKQRKFFADTAYADDELQLRRTILARIATLDTSVKDPTDEQLEETAEMLEMVMEVGAPQNEWEQSAVQRLHDVVVRMRESPRSPAPEERPEETGSAQAAEGAGVTMTGSELDFLRRRYESGASMNARQRALVEAADAQGVERGRSGFVKFSLDPPENAQAAQPVQPVQPAAQPVQPAAQPAAQLAQQPQEPVVKVTAAGGGMVDWNGNPTYGAGMRVPGRDELAVLRRRRDSGASLSTQQRRILELTDGNDLT